MSQPPDSEIRLRRPASEWKAPIFWSLLGVVAFLSAVLAHSGELMQRISLGSVGFLFMVAMWALAVMSKSTEISADQDGLRKTTAFGSWTVGWDQVGSVEQERTIFGRSENTLRSGSDTSFPGREVTMIVFRDHNGRKLLSMSPKMEPAKMRLRLLDLCAERTGLRLEFRTVYERNL